MKNSKKTSETFSEEKLTGAKKGLFGRKETDEVHRSYKQTKKKYGVFSLVFIVVFLGALVAINVFADYASTRLGLRFDLTDSRIYEISDETKNYLKNDLDQDIRITVLALETNYIQDDTYTQIREVLLRYVQLSNGKITLNWVDPYVNPEFVKKYDTLNDLSYNDIIIESDLRFKRLKPANLYTVATSYTTNEEYLSGLDAEQDITSALVYVTLDELPSVLRVTNHGETNLSKLNDLFITSNYSIGTINLTTDKIPDECTMLLIVSPKSDFVAEEIDALDAYFERNGNAVVLFDSSVPNLPNFEQYIEEWGVKYEDLLVADASRSVGHVANVAGELLSHNMNSNLSTSSYVVIPSSRAISTVFSTQGWRTTSTLLRSSSSSYGKAIYSGATITDYSKSDGDVAGPFGMAVLAEQNHVKDYQDNFSRILFSSTGLADDDILSTDTFLNNKFMIQFLNYVGTDSTSIIVQPKYYTSNTLSILESSALFVFIVLVVLIPLATLISGTVVFVKRRHM